MGPERLTLIFDRSPDEHRLLGIDDAVLALRRSAIDVDAPPRPPRDDGIVARVLRFWFPYVSSAGIIGVTHDGTAGEFLVALNPGRGPSFAAALGAWLGERKGRAIRVRVAGAELEARSPDEVDALVSRVEAQLRR